MPPLAAFCYFYFAASDYPGNCGWIFFLIQAKLFPPEYLKGRDLIFISSGLANASN